MERTIVFASLSMALLAPFSTAQSASGLREGDSFPDLRLPTLEDGELRSVSSFRGKKTLLLVFASW